MIKQILMFSFFAPLIVCVGKEQKNTPQNLPLCSPEVAKQEVIKRMDKVYGKDYLIQPIIVRSENKLWDVCAERNISPKKIVHVKVNKDSKNCEIKSITHYEDGIVVNTGDTEAFLQMKKKIECKPFYKTITIKTKHPYPFLKSDFKCSNYGLKENSERCAKLKYFNDR